MSDQSGNPYVGPKTFTRSQSHLFFGREREARYLLSLVVSERLVLFYAQSGGGKSSLINTRLIPGLEAKGFEVLPVGRVGGSPPADIPVSNVFVYNLLLSLSAQEGTPRCMPMPNATIKRFLRQYDARDEATQDSAVADAGHEDENRPRALIIDQFEEILITNLQHWPQREGFFDQLGKAAACDDYLWVILCIREDYVAGLEPYTHLLPGKLKARFYMQRMGRTAALEAVRKPVSKLRPFEAKVAEKLVDNLRRVHIQRPGSDQEPILGEYVKPVQLQIVCHQLWESLEKHPGTTISDQDLERLAEGKDLAQFVDATLSRFYEQAIAKVLGDPQIDVSEPELRDWFGRRLITDDSVRDTVHRGEERTGGLPNEAVDLLESQFLIRAEPRAGGVWYELAHDRFIRPILEANQTWLESTPLVLAARIWEDDPENKDNLYRGRQLRNALRLDERLLGPQVAGFLRASQEAERVRRAQEVKRQEEIRQAKQRADEQASSARRLRWLAVCLVVVALLAIGAAWFAREQQQNALHQEQNALHQEQLARARGDEALTAQSIAESESDARATEVVVRRTAEAEALDAGGTAEAAANAQATEVAVRSTAEEHARNSEERAATRAAEALIARATAAAAAYERATEVAIRSTAEVKAVEARGTAETSLHQLKMQLGLSASRELAAAAVESLTTDPERSVLLAVESTQLLYALDKTVTRQAEEALHRAIQASRVQLLLSPAPGRLVHGVAFSPDGSLVATAYYSNNVKIWDARSGDLVHTVWGQGGGTYDVAFDPQGRRLAAGSIDGTVRIWDVRSGQRLLSLEGHSSAVRGVAFSPDRKLIATASVDGTAALWDALTGRMSNRLTGHDGCVTDVDFSPDSQYLATAGADATAKVWEVASGELSRDFAGHLYGVEGVAFSSDGRYLATASNDNTVRIWDVTTGEEVRTLRGHTNAVLSVAFAGRRLATSSADLTVRIWDVDSGSELLRLAGHASPVTGVAFNHDGLRLATASEDGTARIWNVGANGELLTLVGHSNWIMGIAFHQAGELLATASADGSAKVWRLDAAGDEVLDEETFSGHRGAVWDVDLDPSGGFLATGSGDQTVRIWNIADGTSSELEGHTKQVWGVDFSPDGKLLASASLDETIILWDVRTAKLQQKLSTPSEVWDVAFSPTGTEIAAATADGSVALWDIESLSEIGSLPSDSIAYGIAFSPSGDRLAVAYGNRTVKVWDWRSGEELHTFTGHNDVVRNVAFSPDGKRLVTASYDKTVKVWDSESGQVLLTLTSHTDKVYDVAFSPDGYRLVSVGRDGIGHMYALHIEELIELACSRVTRNLTDAEWNTYVGVDVPYRQTCGDLGD